MLAALARRYQNGHIYTHTGSGIIIAVNPFKPMPHLYDTDAMEAYRSEGAGGGADASPPRAPHVYAVASQAYMRMREEGKGQALLVSFGFGVGRGESILTGGVPFCGDPAAGDFRWCGRWAFQWLGRLGTLGMSRVIKS